MKKFSLLICLISLICLIGKPVYAVVTSTPSAKSATTSGDKVQDLLNRVSDKVTQITEKMRRTYHGSVKTVSTSTITIETSGGNRNIVTNDATDFFRFRAGNKTTIDLKGIKADDDIVAIGTIDPQTTDMTAKQIIAKIHRANFAGTITSMDKSVATITLTDNTQVKVGLDSALTYKKVLDGKIVPAKLADFTINNTIFVIAHSPDLKTEVYSSLKALYIVK